MNIMREWNNRLEYINRELEDYKEILNNSKLNQDMRSFCISKIHSKAQYKQLIEETLKQLEKN